jgi:hypothetical protein
MPGPLPRPPAAGAGRGWCPAGIWEEDPDDPVYANDDRGHPTRRYEGQRTHTSDTRDDGCLGPKKRDADQLRNYPAEVRKLTLPSGPASHRAPFRFIERSSPGPHPDPLERQPERARPSTHSLASSCNPLRKQRLRPDSPVPPVPPVPPVRCVRSVPSVLLCLLSFCAFCPSVPSMRRHVPSRPTWWPAGPRPASRPGPTLLSALVEGALRRRCMLVSVYPGPELPTFVRPRGARHISQSQGRGIGGVPRYVPALRLPDFAPGSADRTWPG